MNVLLIDNDPEFAKDLALLMPSHIRLVGVPGTVSALAVLTGDRIPAAVILDLSLPRFLAEPGEWEGLNLLEVIKRGSARDIPVIVLTAVPRGEAEVSCLERGASAYIEEPCVVNQLVSLLEELTGEDK